MTLQPRYHIIPIGTSEPQDFSLQNDGEAIDGTGLDLELVIYQNVVDEDPVPVDTPPSAAWLDQAAGTVRVTGVEDLEVGLYYVRFKLTDGLGKDGFCPNEDAALWRVVPLAWRA